MKDKAEKGEEIPIENGAWIDYELDNEGYFIWYAILCPEQYTRGHTLVITGPRIKNSPEGLECIKKIFDVHPTELTDLMAGISRVANRLKEKLEGVQNIVIFSLNEDKEHLHFHLIPRYTYSNDEKDYNIKCSFDKAKTEERWIKNPDKVHGIWYYAYHEQNYKNQEYWIDPPETRANKLNKLASKLRNRKKYPEFKEIYLNH